MRAARKFLGRVIVLCIMASVTFGAMTFKACQTIDPGGGDTVNAVGPGLWTLAVACLCLTGYLVGEYIKAAREEDRHEKQVLSIKD